MIACGEDRMYGWCGWSCGVWEREMRSGLAVLFSWSGTAADTVSRTVVP